MGWRVGRRGRCNNKKERAEISTVLAAMVGLGRNYFVWCLYQALHSEICLPACDLLTLIQYVIKCR